MELLSHLSHTEWLIIQQQRSLTETCIDSTRTFTTPQAGRPPSSSGEWNKHLLISVLSAVWIVSRLPLQGSHSKRKILIEYTNIAIDVSRELRFGVRLAAKWQWPDQGIEAEGLSENIFFWGKIRVIKRKYVTWLLTGKYNIAVNSAVDLMAAMRDQANRTTNPIVRTCSSAATLTSLCADISPSSSHFFEVLYVGKVKVNQKKVCDTFIDDTLDKFRNYELEKERKNALLNNKDEEPSSCQELEVKDQQISESPSCSNLAVISSSSDTSPPDINKTDSPSTDPQ
ncbi:TBC1 domain member 4 [Homalodisca vitripennis]|nr:TBC1 domain member 4 [Homalodisca vitripennis]